MPAFPFFHLVAIVLIILANAFFATVEFALVSARRTWLQQRASQGDSRAEAALKLIGDLNGVVSGTQVGITMTSLALGWVGEITLATVLQPLLIFLPAQSAVVVHSIAVTVAFLGLTFLHVVLGELVPKQVALGRAERLALLVAWPMTVFLKIVRGPQAMLHGSAFFLARHLGARESGAAFRAYSAEELKLLVTAAYHGGALPGHQQEMIHNVMDLRQVLVREIMVPRPNIVSIPASLSLEETLRMVIEDQHSRLPVYEDSPEQVIGVLYTKDLFRVWQERDTVLKIGQQSRPFSLRSLVREILVVPETKPIDQLLQEFQQRRRHMALVVDEFGSTVGLVTVEDVLEQIVGEIQDEYDWEIPPGLRLGERTLVLEARINILDLENQYDVRLPRDQGFETLAGFVLDQFGYIPRAGESFDYEGWRFTVLEVESHRVTRVKAERLPERQEAAEKE
ncbi:MAG: HlyC/CorC family transporter [Acidobacteria bacterium]|nr:HlyC/CorC family transporter [Acidobacteriota bacterium]